MAILCSLCKKTTTFWREVRTMAIILRLLQVCSSLFLVRMLALPYAAHIVLPLPPPSQPTRPQPSWRDAHTLMHTWRKRGKSHSRAHSASTLCHKRSTLWARARFLLSLYNQSLTHLSHTKHTIQAKPTRRDSLSPPRGHSHVLPKWETQIICDGPPFRVRWGRRGSRNEIERSRGCLEERKKSWTGQASPRAAHFLLLRLWGVGRSEGNTEGDRERQHAQCEGRQTTAHAENPSMRKKNRWDAQQSERVSLSSEDYLH